MAACKFCQCTMKAHLKSLKVHAACVKHHTNTLGRQTIIDKDLEPTNPENNQRGTKLLIHNIFNNKVLWILRYY